MPNYIYIGHASDETELNETTKNINLYENVYHQVAITLMHLKVESVHTYPLLHF